MSEKFSKEPLRGLKDFYPSDLREINWIKGMLEDIAELYCYEEFEAPLLEPIEIYAAKSSEELVNEQAFIVEKKNGKKWLLRPELTPSLARMIAKKSQEIKKPIRWYSTPMCYRYERPQKGRRREFLQFNADILGEESLYAEIEILNMCVDILTSFGATSEQFQIFYNNRRFIDAFTEIILELPKEKMPEVYALLDKSDKLEENEFEKFVIDTFQDEFIVQGILKLKEAENLKDLLKKFNDIPEDFYKSDGYNELIKLNKMIDDVGLTEYCTFSPSIVRGLAYYTGTVFEVYDTGKENIRAIFGGGRYDDLLSLFSDEQLSGIGFGMGILMLSLFLKTYDLIPDFIREKDYSDTIYIASVNEDVANYSIELADIMRTEDLPCIVDYRFKNLKSQLSKASELGILITLIVGPQEMEKDEIVLRNMVTNKQKIISNKDLIDEIYKLLDEIDDTASEE